MFALIHEQRGRALQVALFPAVQVPLYPIGVSMGIQVNQEAISVELQPGRIAQQLLLGLVQPGGHVHHDLHQEVTPPPALHVGHAPPPQAEHASRLRAGGHDQVLDAVERLEGKVHAQGGLGHGQVQGVDHVVALAGEPGMREHAQVHVEVAGRPAPGPGAAPTGQAQARAVVDPGGDVDGVGTLVGPAALPPALGTGAGDLLTRAGTTGADRARDHLAQDRLAHPAQLARALALPAPCGGGAGPGSAAVAPLAQCGDPHLDLALGAEHGLLEGEPQGELGVGPPELGRPPPPPAAAEGAGAAEEGLEDVAQAAAETTGEGVSPAWARALDGLGAEKVVAAPALGVPQRLVCLCHRLEALLGRGVAGPGVGVQLPGQAAVGALDVLLTGLG